jgi:CRISPR-associated protein Cas1
VVKAAIVDGYGKVISVFKGNVVVCQMVGGKKARKVINIADVDRLIITTSGVAVTSRALRVLARYGVDLVVLDASGCPITVLTPPWITATVEARRGQYLAYADQVKALEIAKAFACAKIENQSAYLRYLSKMVGEKVLYEEAEKVLEMKRRVQGVSGALDEARKEIMSLEGTAARLYWGAIATVLPRDLGFDGRDQDGLDPVNRALNYLYGVLYSECFKALTRVGLDPYAGFLHSDRSGNPTLVFDFVEMFRVSAVDSLLVRLFKDLNLRISIDSRGFIARESRVVLVQEFFKWISRKARDSRGEVKELEAHIKSYAIKMARFFRHSLGEPPIFVEVWWS